MLSVIAGKTNGKKIGFVVKHQHHLTVIHRIMTTIIRADELLTAAVYSGDTARVASMLEHGAGSVRNAFLLTYFLYST